MKKDRGKSNMKRDLEFAKSKYPDLPIFESHLKVPFKYVTINELLDLGVILKDKKLRPDAIAMKKNLKEYYKLYLRERFLIPDYID